jgi:hypothetical protein
MSDSAESAHNGIMIIGAGLGGLSLALALAKRGIPYTTALEHYLNMPFMEEDRLPMKPWVEGWV